MSQSSETLGSGTPERYRARVASEIRHFSGLKEFHLLPGAHHYWANKYLRPEVERVFGCTGPVEIYARECVRAFGGGAPRRIASLGCGRGDTEVKIAARLRELGETRFQIECFEISPSLCAEGLELARQTGLQEHLSFTEVDLNRWTPAQGGEIGVVIANEILHHIVELEQLFDGIARALAPEGRLLTRDMMGRNGHRCWPEVREIVDRLWAVVPERCHYDPMAQRSFDHYPDRDCSSEGFEGIRSQDVLPLLLERLHFERFVGFGGLIERFAGRAFGHGFRVNESEEDRALIDMIYLLNHVLVEQGVMKPTQFIATLALRPVSATCGFGWTPEWCLRPPNA